MELHGVSGAPYKHPEVRRKMPAAFSRPSISIGGGSTMKRVWADVPVTKLNNGDTVAGFGTIEAISEFIDKQPDSSEMPWRFRLFNVAGQWRDYLGSDRVFAFAKESGE